MTRRIAQGVLVLALVTACKGKESDSVPVDTTKVALGTKTPANPSAQPQGNAARPVTPAPAPAPANPDAAALASARTVFTVQVAALSPEQAKWWVTELGRQGIPAYTTSATVAGAAVTRLRIGAATSSGDARMLADKIHEKYKWPTWITTVDDRTALPANALTASKGYVGR
jgi:cell division septation protein DedD